MTPLPTPVPAPVTSATLFDAILQSLFADAAPAQPGTVVLGDQSRFVIEFGDGSLSVFNILQILNTARTPVPPGAPALKPFPK